MFIIIRIVDTLHKGLSIIYFVCQSTFEQPFDGCAVSHARGHGSQVIFLVHQAPVDTLPQILFQHEVEPDAGASAVTLTEWVRHIHLYIFVDYLLKRIFSHLIYLPERRRQVGRHGKLKAALGNIHRADIAGEVVQTTKQVGVNLLETLRRSHLYAFYHAAFKQGVSLRFALAVDALFAVRKPCYKARSLGVGKAGNQLQNAFCVEHIS